MSVPLLESNPLVDLRVSLIRNGYRIVAVDGKRPRIKGWQRAHWSVDQVEGYTRTYADHLNTGILTGEVVAIDIDVLHPDTAERLIERLFAIPGASSAPCRTGNAPKCLFVFRTGVSATKMSTAEYIVDGSKCQVEVLGQGQQFVAYGTHPDTGKEYVWSSGDPLSVPLADLPVLEPETIAAFLADAETILADAGAPARKPATTHQPQPKGDSVWTRVNTAALSDIEAWVPSLFSTARREAGTGAWRVSSADLGRGLEEDISIHPGGIRDFGTEQPSTPIQLVMDFGGAPSPKDALLWLCEQIGQDPAQFGWEVRRPATIRFDSAATPAAANDDNEEWQHEEVELYRSDATLSELTRPGGFVEEMIDWIVSSAEHPSRELALSAVIPFVGALIGRRFAGYRDARSNVYIIALAPSGYGKDHARQQIKRLTAAENLHPFAGPARLMSASGLRAALMEKPSMSCMIDEVGGPFREMLDPRANLHQAMLKNDLLEYFSTASTYFEGAAYAQAKAVKLENPNLCLYGTSTQDDFWNSVSSLSARDGFLARLLLFDVQGEKPALVVPEQPVKDIPAHIRTSAKALSWAGRKGKLDAPGSDKGSKGRRAIDVPLTPDAEKRRLQFKHDIEQKLKKATGPDVTILNRAVEHAVKLALIVAVGTDWEKPKITERQMTWAVQLAWLSCCALMRESKLYIADSQREGNVNRILRLILEAGSDGLPKGRLTDRTRGIDRRQREEILDDLHQAKRIVTREQPPSKAGGRPTSRLYAA